MDTSQRPTYNQTQCDERGRPPTNSRRSFITFETASRTGICSLILRTPVMRSSIVCMELIVLRYCIIGFWGNSILALRENRTQVDSRRTGKRLISSRSATMRRDNRIKESRISSSSFRVRLRSSGVYTRLRLKSSLSSRDQIRSMGSEKQCVPAKCQIQLAQQAERTARIS